MPHAVEMPSFLSDDTGPSLSSNRPLFDLPQHRGPSYEKVNGNTKSSSHTSMNGSVGEGSDSYGRGSGHPQMNGDMLHEGNLNSIANGRTSASSWDRSSRNASLLSVNGGVNGGVNGVSENGRRSPAAAPQNGLPRMFNGDRNSTSTNGNTQTTPPPIEAAPKPSTNGDSETSKRLSVPAPISTHPGSTGPLTYSSSLLPATPLAPETPPRAATTSPHRFSSPPSYPAPSVPSPSTNSSPHPGLTQLKHRHTLQVPKAVPGQVMPDEDAMRWAEAVRQKRASKRRRKDEEDDDRVVVGTKVDQNHVNWVTAYNMLTGIRFTVSRTNAKLDRALTDADFEAKHKFSFDITGNELTPSAKYDFKFKDYAPWVFRHLRAKFKLDPADYLMSLTSKYILSELGSPGKSGSFFYFSRDYKYIIKTIHHAEHKFLRKILKEYYQHVEQNPNTLLSQFYGLHRVKIPYGRKIHFVVMNNLFPPHRDIHQTFDLKGSTIGRDFKEEDLEKNPRATLKDLNWLRRDLHLEFGSEKKRIFFEQMERDVHLLQKLKIMDYSMLVGIHDLQKGNQENLRDKTLRIFQPGGDNPSEDLGPPGPGPLMRTPSKLENQKIARDLRATLKQQKPVPMGESSSRMPDTLEENTIKRDFIFYSDDGGFRATHEDNSPGDEIFFLSIIDCLTHYGTVKKLEHLWKGFSHDKKLISPIRPEPYGERFIEFIEGITKSPEEAAREAQEAPRNSLPHTNSNPISNRNTTSIDSARRRSGSHPIQRTSMNNATVTRNENDALKGEKNGEESDKPEPRTIGVVRSPSAERTNGLQGQTLPVVEELGEASSTGGRSGHSRERPMTPAKDNSDGRPLTPAKDYSPNSNGLRRPISRQSLDKDLPPLPKATSPAPMDEKDSIFRR
ncbi:Phosphatidylinositol 4-phosphate 5-kinase its3 [Lachnellula suecica]|uniref:1-phosphatidylinositol-4-phosphate 5-kinase n=1 Tax=Lachnellula suecica TaxID=602035 RepID=A0A8T9CF41_9HELO|nr:Phosphatidylinositol 4-phosphate 5-kinase its3 [Lachnellula suecica]